MLKPDIKLPQAIRQAGVSEPSRCLFVDDSRQNVVSAKKLGWGRCVHFYEGRLENRQSGRSTALDQSGNTATDADGIVVINNLEELRVVWSDIFRR